MTAWQGVPPTFPLKQFSCCLKTSYCLHIVWWAEFITSLQRQKGLTQLILLLETISAPLVQAVLEVLCQPAASAAALCDTDVGTVSNLPLPFSSSMCRWGPAAQTRPPVSPAARWAPGAGTPSPPAPTSSRTSATTACSRPLARETSPRSSWPATSWRERRWGRGQWMSRVGGGKKEMDE